MNQRVGPIDDPDRYEVRQLHSRGGEGELWRGSLDIDGVPIAVAIKVLHHGATTDVAEEGRRWQRQAELLRTLDHPNLVKVREVFVGPAIHAPGAADGAPSGLYLVMNWVEGDSGDAWVARHPERDVLESVRVISRLADGVDYLHSGIATSRPVLHRDIKPANVMIDGPEVRLVDFGLARILADSPLTLAGTPAYLAPEVIDGQSYSEATDRYALGATAYFLLTGQRPDPRGHDGMLAALRAVDGAGGRSDLAEHVLAMMDPDPARRPTDCTSWARGLAAAAVTGGDATIRRDVGGLGSADVGQRDATTERVGDGPAGRRWPKVAAIVGALAIVLGGGAAARALLGDDDPVEAADAGDEGEATTQDDVATEIDAEPEDEPGEDLEPDPVPEPEPEPEPDMPELVGQHLDAARGHLDELGLGPVAVDEEESGEAPGTVLHQRPPAGSEVVDGVTLIVAVVPSAIPDVVGLSLDDAQSVLEALGIDGAVTQVLDPDAPPGIVLAQSPEGGSDYRTSAELQVATRGVGRYLVDLRPVEGSVSQTGTFAVDGETYTRAVGQSVGGGTSSRSAGYDLGRGYERFQASVGLHDASPSDGQVRFEIFGDGHELYRVTLGLGETEEVDLEVGEVLRLEIVATRLSDRSRTALIAVFADARLVGFEDRVPDLDD